MSNEKKPISKHLTEMLTKLPKEGWFTIDDISESQVYRAQWVLTKLTEADYLQQRVEWVNENWAEDEDYRTISFYRQPAVTNEPTHMQTDHPMDMFDLKEDGV